MLSWAASEPAMMSTSVTDQRVHVLQGLQVDGGERLLGRDAVCEIMPPVFGGIAAQIRFFELRQGGLGVPRLGDLDEGGVSGVVVEGYLDAFGERLVETPAESDSHLPKLSSLCVDAQMGCMLSSPAASPSSTWTNTSPRRRPSDS